MALALLMLTYLRKRQFPSCLHVSIIDKVSLAFPELLFALCLNSPLVQ